MTTQARLVLEDCKEALAEFTDGITGSLLRRRWITIVTLLRTVGYVLDTEDSKISPKMKDVIDTEWAALNKKPKEPPIFHDFIDAERNNLVHNYKSGAHLYAQSTGGATFLAVRVNALDRMVRIARKDETAPIYAYLMSDLPFAGRDPRDVVAEAITWWEGYLDAIDRRVNEEPTAQSTDS